MDHKYSNILSPFEEAIAQWRGSEITVHTPVDGSVLARLRSSSKTDIDDVLLRAKKAFRAWSRVPAPRRGQLVRLLGEKLRENKEELAQLVSLECGKILEEARGEVQEMIDICEFAVGLSRQLYGLTMSSERPEHVMTETWHPLGPVGIITAFNFPVAVWSWNAALALVCGDSLVWKPSEKTPLCAIAVQKYFEEACVQFGDAPPNLNQLVLGYAEEGEVLVDSPAMALISATGSTRMGRQVGPRVAARFGRSLLELGGNNAIIVTPSADLDISIPSIVFGAVGTCGQRCTSTRRLIVHESIYDEVFDRVKRAYQNLLDQQKIGSPLDPTKLIGPLIDAQAFEAMQAALTRVSGTASEVFGGYRENIADAEGGYYVAPALVKISRQTEVVLSETFAPILYVLPYRTLEEALEIHNAAPQGLSGAIMTTDIREAEYFRQHADCGIANVNIGTSGAEIGGAFGGEKETGGGRESGSDSWKAYMRRQTSTVFYGQKPPDLAQGITFEQRF